MILKTPLVSVVLPTYNRANSLFGAVQSVLSQTLNDFELIIVDDNSTDNTHEIVQFFIKQIGIISRFRKSETIGYHKLSENSGSPVIPRNYGCSKARGKYIAFIDSDDVWSSEKLETQVGYLETIGGNFSYHNLLVKYSSGKRELWNRMSTCYSGEVFEVLLKKNFIPTSSVVLTREIYNKYGPMDMRYKVSHDWDLWLKIAFENQLHYIPDILGGVLNIHENSVISDSYRRRKESIRVIKSWMQYVDGMWYRKIMLYYCLMIVFDCMPGFIKNKIRGVWYGQEKYK